MPSAQQEQSKPLLDLNNVPEQISQEALERIEARKAQKAAMQQQQAQQPQTQPDQPQAQQQQTENQHTETQEKSPEAPKNDAKKRPLEFDPKACTADLFLGERPKDPPLVFDGLPRGCLGALVAPPGTGKSTFIAQMLAVYADGGSLFGKWFVDGPRKSIFLSCEDPHTTLQQRVYDALQGVPAERRREAAQRICVPDVHGRVYLFAVNKDKITPTDAFSDLVRSIETFRPDLVVLDTLSRFCGGVEGTNPLMGDACSYLEEVARRYNLAFILPHHNSKASGGTMAHSERDTYMLMDPYASRGPTALTGSVRWQMNFAPLSADYATTIIGDNAKGKPDKMYIVGCVCKKNIGVPEGRVYFVHNGMTGLLERVEPLPDEQRNKNLYEDLDRLVEVVKSRKVEGLSPVTASKPKPETTGLSWGSAHMKKVVDLGVEMGMLTRVKNPNGNGYVLELVEDVPPEEEEQIEEAFFQDIRKSSLIENDPQENEG